VGPSILIVDDRDAISEVMVELLRSSGYDKVDRARSGSEALERFSDARPDLVLLDLVLPDMPGLVVAGNILDIDDHARIIAMSALSRDGLVDESLRAGCMRFLAKPFRTRELLRVIAEVLGSDEG